ncbi:MAG: glycosyltransferase family 4 protein [Bryobacterales bacterium]|nr:glycosyltransferase family 4 protein [Bryobacterales bacterium]
MVEALLLSQFLDIGGTERQIAEVARALPRHGVRAAVASLRPGGMRARELKAAGVEVLCFEVRSFVKPSLLPPARALYRFVRERRIQVVHAFDPPAAVFATPLAKLAGVPLVLSSMRGERGFLPAKMQRALQMTDRIVDGIVVNCDFLRQELLTRYRVPAAHLDICYNGVDRAIFQPGPRQRPPELAEASLVVGCVAALRPEKSILTVIQALAKVNHPGVKLVIVGSGPDEPRLRAEAESNGLLAQGRCLFIPSTPEVAKWNRAMDIFVIPSLTEAFSNSLLEAMSSGCAAIGSRVGGIPELIADGQTGLLFEPGNPVSLAVAIEKMASDAPLRARCIAAAEERIAREFTMDASAAAMADIYTRRLAKR